MVAPSLLITDDDRDFRETLRDMFEPRGFHLLTAGDGEEAVEILRHETVNVALFDMHMPRLNGLDAIRRLREFRLPPTWILLSAEADEQLIAEARPPEFPVLLTAGRSGRDYATLFQAMRGVPAALAVSRRASAIACGRRASAWTGGIFTVTVLSSA